MCLRSRGHPVDCKVRSGVAPRPAGGRFGRSKPSCAATAAGEQGIPPRVLLLVFNGLHLLHRRFGNSPPPGKLLPAARM